MKANQDAFYMAYAIKVAEQSKYITDPNPHVGCVIVKDGKILAEGRTQRAGGAHAEIDALARLSIAQTQGATAYVTLEPCSHYGRTGPCVDALIASGVHRVVIAMQDPNPLVSGRGIEKLLATGIEVECGVLQNEAEQLNKGFFKRMTYGLPYIYSKIAASMDGRTAMASGESQWITSSESRQDVQKYRAACSAIVTGIGTVLIDNPRLNARVEFDLVQPIKVVLDSKLRIPLSCTLLHDPQSVWIISCSHNPVKQQQLLDLGCKVWQVSETNGRPDLLEVFKLLANEQINTVWVEAGATLNGALLANDLVDEWLIYLAPCVLGDQGRGMFHLPGLNTMAEKKQLALVNFRQLGADLKLTFSSRLK